MSEHSDLTKIRALLAFASETDGSVTLAGESAALVAAAIDKAEQDDMSQIARGLARKVGEYRSVLRALGIDTAKLEQEGDLSDCPAYFGDGTCQRGCWTEPLCQVNEPCGGWPLAKVRRALRDLERGA